MQSLNCSGSMEVGVNLSKCTFYAVLHSEDNNKQKFTQFMTLSTVIPRKAQALILSNGQIDTGYFSKDLDMAGIGNKCLLYSAIDEPNVIDMAHIVTI